jgi:hypothetical protein
MNTTSIARQAASLALSALATLVVLSSINGLATTPAPDSLLAVRAKPAQVVVTEVHRSARA